MMWLGIVCGLYASMGLMIGAALWWTIDPPSDWRRSLRDTATAAAIGVLWLPLLAVIGSVVVMHVWETRRRKTK